ncbi:hypothetical protein GIB67_025532 [Kingdonia uniflora]|uniref:Zinc finger GRF-type domain-containing protein n=1 Tax=Kingdonia uniflora TaxID=39325 RepID=A0A7J7M0B5_9MAGN|nr:hypothetical protein GIB67_025532 [Kingdonia uniflora]
MELVKLNRRVRQKLCTSALTGKQYVHELIQGPATNMYNMMRIDPDSFRSLVAHFRDTGLLKDSMHIDVEEKLPIFMHIIAHKMSNRAANSRFRHSTATTSKIFHEVLDAMMIFQKDMIFKNADMGGGDNNEDVDEELPPNAILFGADEREASIVLRDMIAAELALAHNAQNNTHRDCGFWCWLDEYMICPCGVGPCKLITASISKRRFYYCPQSKSKHEKGCGFFNWFDDVKDDDVSSSTCATPSTSTTFEELENKLKMDLLVSKTKTEMLESFLTEIGKLNLKD